MKLESNKGALICMCFGIFLLLFGILCQSSLAAQNRNAGGEIGAGKVVFTVKSSSNSTGKSGFSIKDIENISEKLKIANITYFAHSSAKSAFVKVNESSCTAAVTGTNYMLPGFMALPLVSGCFFTKSMEAEGDAVAVVDDEFAWKVFGSGNIAGKTIKLNGIDFRITGVFKRDSSVIGGLIEDGLPEIYIPGGYMLENDKTARIDSIQVKAPNTDTLDQNRQLIIDALGKTGENANDYNITDFNITQALLDQKPSLAVFFIGTMIILMLIATIYKELLLFIKRLYEECRSDYLSNVVKDNRGTILFTFLKTGIAVPGIILTVILIRFRFYIPPKLVPEELINTGYYFDLIVRSIHKGITDMGHVASYPELYAGKIGILTNLLFLVVAVGLLMVFASAGKMNSAGLNPFKSMLTAGTFFILSLIIQFIAAKNTGLPFVLEYKGLFVVWAFIYYLLLHNEMKGKEEGL